MKNKLKFDSSPFLKVREQREHNLLWLSQTHRIHIMASSRWDVSTATAYQHHNTSSKHLGKRNARMHAALYTACKASAHMEWSASDALECVVISYLYNECQNSDSISIFGHRLPVQESNYGVRATAAAIEKSSSGGSIILVLKCMCPCFRLSTMQTTSQGSYYWLFSCGTTWNRYELDWIKLCWRSFNIKLLIGGVYRRQFRL